MDSMAFDSVKTEKLNAMKNYRRQRNFELCLALLFLSWLFGFIPIPFYFSGEYFRPFFSLFNSTFYVFILSNLIILTVALSFKNFSVAGAVGSPVSDIYNEFVTDTESQQRVSNSGDELLVIEASPEEKFEDKRIVTSENVELKLYRRTQSENLEKGGFKKPCKKLRRSATAVCRKMVVPGEGKVRNEVEEMSNEEFKMKIEAFIAKQKWNQIQEQFG